MKYIFDFDDTLFFTGQLKEKISSSLEEAGLSRDIALNYYEFRDKTVPFSLKKFLIFIFAKENISSDPNEVYENIMSLCKDIANPDLVAKAKLAGSENCFLVTNGDKEFQMDKITKSGMEGLFSEIHIVNGSKKNIIENICQKFPQEKIVFYDDKEKFFTDINISKCPNLETVLYGI